MKNQRRLFLFSAIFLFLFVTLTVTVLAFRSNLSFKRGDEPFSLLVCGLDESGLNTDVMFLACAEPEKERFTVLQIPRDTLVLNKKGESVKINSRFAAFRSSGMSGREAAVALKKEISSLFGLKISNVVIPTTEAVASLVDLLGGIKVTVPKDISYSDPSEEQLFLRAGEQVLNGRQAVAFLRFRSGYARGDLARMDAQKLFLSGVVARLRKGVSVSFAAKAAGILSGQKIYTDMNLLSGIESSYRMMENCNGKLYLATLPGEALYTDSTWYYVVRRAGAEALFADCFTSFYREGNFDFEKRLCNPKNLGVMNAYGAPNRAYRMYAENELSKLSFE